VYKVLRSNTVRLSVCVVHRLYGLQYRPYISCFSEYILSFYIHPEDSPRVVPEYCTSDQYVVSDQYRRSLYRPYSKCSRALLGTVCPSQFTARTRFSAIQCPCPNPIFSQRDCYHYWTSFQISNRTLQEQQIICFLCYHPQFQVCQTTLLMFGYGSTNFRPQEPKTMSLFNSLLNQPWCLWVELTEKPGEILLVTTNTELSIRHKWVVDNFKALF